MNNQSYGTGILGLGSYLPPGIRTNDFWPPEFLVRDDQRADKDLLALDRQKSALPPEIIAAQAPYFGDPFKGAVQRHVLRDGEETAEMEARAATRAIEAAGLSKEDIDLVFVHSLTPDLLHPANAPAVQAKCGLPRATAIAIDNGCCSPHLMFCMASAMIRAGMARNVVCVASSGATRTVDTMNPNSPIFGDGAAAFVVGKVPSGYGLLGQFMNTNGKFRDAIVHAFVVDGKPQRDWYRGEGSVRLASFAPEMGRETGALQIDFCREAAGGALAIAEKTAKDVRLFLGPQSVVWLNGALAAGLGFTKEQTIDTFTEVGNISPATLAFNLQAADQRGMLSDGDLVLAYSPGAGLTRAAVLFRWWSPKKNNA